MNSYALIVNILWENVYNENVDIKDFVMLIADDEFVHGASR